MRRGIYSSSIWFISSLSSWSAIPSQTWNPSTNWFHIHIWCKSYKCYFLLLTYEIWITALTFISILFLLDRCYGQYFSTHCLFIFILYLIILDLDHYTNIMLVVLANSAQTQPCCYGWINSRLPIFSLYWSDWVQNYVCWRSFQYNNPYSK